VRSQRRGEAVSSLAVVPTSAPGTTDCTDPIGDCANNVRFWPDPDDLQGAASRLLSGVDRL
jgi:hypothetical protein